MPNGFDVDKAGALASGVCAVHCALVGLAVATLPVFGAGFLADHRVEAVFFSVAVLLAVWAMARGLKIHGDWRPSGLLAGGLGSVSVSHFLIGHQGIHAGHVHLAIGGTAPGWVGALGTLLAVGGGLSLVGFHFWNHRLTQKGCGCSVCRASDVQESSVSTRVPS
ncbi:MAG: MerC domain-containing protein [Fimbriimonadaceae bacterium]|nr:MerC domain-containing protein [Fimbriimonadaceae bacterium]QYK59295.1 MAG: MerC domain-containing protein [Fimbriimonadaceae bacterium]